MKIAFCPDALTNKVAMTNVMASLSFIGWDIIVAITPASFDVIQRMP